MGMLMAREGITGCLTGIWFCTRLVLYCIDWNFGSWSCNIQLRIDVHVRIIRTYAHR